MATGVKYDGNKDDVMTIIADRGDGRVAMMEIDGKPTIVFGYDNEAFKHDPGHAFPVNADTFVKMFALQIDDPEQLRNIMNYLNECHGRLRAGDAFPFAVGMCF